MSQRIITAQETAARLFKSVAYVKAHSRFHNPRQPVLKAVKILGIYHYDEADVDQFLADNTVTKTSKE